MLFVIHDLEIEKSKYFHFLSRQRQRKEKEILSYNDKSEKKIGNSEIFSCFHGVIIETYMRVRKTDRGSTIVISIIQNDYYP